MTESVGSTVSRTEWVQSRVVVTPESTTLSDVDMMDAVILEVFGSAKFSKLISILDSNDIDNLIELAMYDCDELVELQGSVPSHDAPDVLKLCI